MASFLISGVDEVAKTMGVADDVVILKQGSLWVGVSSWTASPAISIGATGVSNDIRLEGSLGSVSSRAIWSDPASINSTVTIGRSGSVSASYAGDAIQLNGDYDVIVNFGEISGRGGIQTTGQYAEIHNTGVITASDSIGIESTGQTADILNSGHIISSYRGVVVTGGFSDIGNTGVISAATQAIMVGGSASLNIVNSGTVTSLSSGLFSDTSGAVSLKNSGTFDGSNQAINHFGNGVMTVHNSGKLIGDVVSSGTDGARIDIKNLGTIQGDVDAGVGSSTFVNRGQVDGDINLMAGNDTFDGRKGDVSGKIAGGKGDDHYWISDGDVDLVEKANGGFDAVFSSDSVALAKNVETLALLGARKIDGTGNASDNTINGNSHDNRLTGLAGNDLISGAAGDDILRGGKHQDTLNGNDDNDRLFGGSGNDQLFGNAGSDILIGGAGADILFGGQDSDRDIFRFRTVTDSPRGAAKRDSIGQFERGEDLIDLSGLDAHIGKAGDQAFAFSGSGPAANSVWVVVSGSDVLLRGDVEGNRSIDFEILVGDLSALGAGDVIL